MKLLILSDTHGNLPLICRAVSTAGKIDSIIHLGDEVDDTIVIKAITDCPVINVAGNCDRGSYAPREVSLLIGGIPFLITHGDAYQVKAGLHFIQKKAMAENVGVVLYGHTHRASIEIISGINFVNPGTLHQASAHKSYALLTIRPGNIDASLTFLE